MKFKNFVLLSFAVVFSFILFFPVKVYAETDNLVDFKTLNLVSGRGAGVNASNPEVIYIDRSNNFIEVKSVNAQGIMYIDNIKLMNSSHVKLKDGTVKDVRDLTYIYNATIKLGEYADDSPAFGAGLVFKFENRSGLEGARGERRLYLRFQQNGIVGIEQLSGLADGKTPTKYIGGTKRLENVSGTTHNIKAIVKGQEITIYINDILMFDKISVPDFPAVPEEGKAQEDCLPAFGLMVSRNKAIYKNLSLTVEEEIEDYYYSGDVVVVDQYRDLKFYLDDKEIEPLRVLGDKYFFDRLNGLCEITIRQSGFRDAKVSLSENNKSAFVVLKKNIPFVGKINISNGVKNIEFMMDGATLQPSDINGNLYIFNNLPGDVVITVKKDGYKDFNVHLTFEHPETEVMFMAIPQKIKVKVVDGEGNAVTDALVYTKGMSAYECVDGEYEFVNVDKTESVTIAKEGYETKTIQIEPGMENTEVVLKKIEGQGCSGTINSGFIIFILSFLSLSVIYYFIKKLRNTR